MDNPILLRQAVRKFQSTKLSNEDIDKLITAFQASPCALGKAEVVQGITVSDSAYVEKIEKATDNSCYGAPFIFVIVTKKGSRFGERDASVAAENVMIQAAALNLGSVYVMSGALTLNSHPDLLKKLGIGDDYEASVLVPVGQPENKLIQPDRNNRYKVIQH